MPILGRKANPFLNILCFPLRSRSTSGRTAFNPEGFNRFSFVNEGNILGCRTVFCLWLAACRGARFILEQPHGSILGHHPSMNMLFKYVCVARNCFGKCFSFTWSCEDVLGICLILSSAAMRFFNQGSGWAHLVAQHQSVILCGLQMLQSLNAFIVLVGIFHERMLWFDRVFI